LVSVLIVCLLPPVSLHYGRTGSLQAIIRI